jgi:hypothetical protein
MNATSSSPRTLAPGITGRRRLGPALAAVIVAALGLPVCTARAGAADETSACLASYERAQVLRRDHRLGRARAELKSCSRVVCPSLARNDCINWLDQVQAAFPSLTIRAVKNGVDLANVRIVEDNEVVATRLDGTSLEVEPGEHAFRFETDDAPAVTMTIVVREREKDRIVPVAFASPHSAGSPREEVGTLARPMPVGAWVLGGVGLAGIASFAVLGSLAKNDQSALQGSCSPNCTQGSIDKVKNEYIAADVGLGVGAASLVAAGVWYLLRPSKTEAAPAPQDGLAIAPSRDGARIQWNGTF